MKEWTGLLLRVENEAQLAAVLGHEIGHYLARHSIERLRQARSNMAAAQIMGLFGVVGLVGQLGVAASMMAYSRDNESEADRIGLLLMHKAGYATAEPAARAEGTARRRREESAFRHPPRAGRPPAGARQARRDLPGRHAQRR